MHLSAQYFEKSSFSVWHNHYFSVKDKSKNDGSSNLDVLMLGVLVGINDKRRKRGAEEMGDRRTSRSWGREVAQNREEMRRWRFKKINKCERAV